MKAARDSSGNAMAMMVRQVSGRTQLVVLGGPIPQEAETEEDFFAALDTLHTSPWFDSEAEAKSATLPVYFSLYERMEGFKHPDDPSQVAADSMEGSSR